MIFCGASGKMEEDGAATEVSCNDKGELRVTGFDSSGMGKDAVDLMTATKPDVTYEGGGTMPPVLLAFEHELAQVKLTVRTGEKLAEVSDIRLLVWTIGVTCCGHRKTRHGKAG